MTTDALANIIDATVTQRLASLESFHVGDHTRAQLVPEGHRVEYRDVRQDEDLPRARAGEFGFVGVDSLCRYVERYKTDDTLAYVHDIYGRGASTLVAPFVAAEVVLDDHPAGNPADLVHPAANREHVAQLVLSPTAAGRRWGAAFHASALSQDQFLDLVVDGIGEITTPDGAHLRDLISDLYATRTTEVASVIRTGGQGQIQLTENVQLRAGTGRVLEFPEQITIVLAPYVALPVSITLEVRVKPTVGDGKVRFGLAAPDLDDKIARALGEIAAEIVERTELNPLWVR